MPELRDICRKRIILFNLIEEIYSQLLRCEKKIKINMNTPVSWNHILYELKSSHPSLFHFSSLLIRKENGNEIVLYPQYIFDVYQYESYKRQISKAVVNIKSKLLSLKTTEDRIKCTHDYLCKNITYSNPSDAVSHCLIGPLLLGNGVCDGISQAAQFLLKIAKIESYIVTGNARNGLNASFVPHSWNIVNACNKWRHFDFTFDICMSDNYVRYDYYSLSRKQILQDHRITFIPSIVEDCSENDYYYLHKTVFKDRKSVANCLLDAIKNRLTNVQFRYDSENDKIGVDDLRMMLESLFTRYQMLAKYYISMNEIRSVFSLNLEYK